MGELLGLAFLSLVLAGPSPPLGADGAAAPRMEPVWVVLRATAASTGPFVRLGEVADLPNAPPRLKEFLEGLFLGLAPDPGGLREIDGGEVAARIQELGLPADLVRVKGSPRATVFVEAQAATASPGGKPPESAKARPAARPGPARAERAPREAKPAVEKGSAVTLRRAGRALIIEELARAHSAGSEGDVIEVQNLRTGKKIPARVVGPGVVTPLAGDAVREAGEKEGE